MEDKNDEIEKLRNRAVFYTIIRELCKAEKYDMPTFYMHIKISRNRYFRIIHQEKANLIMLSRELAEATNIDSSYFLGLKAFTCKDMCDSKDKSIIDQLNEYFKHQDEYDTDDKRKKDEHLTALRDWFSKNHYKYEHTSKDDSLMILHKLYIYFIKHEGQDVSSANMKAADALRYLKALDHEDILHASSLKDLQEELHKKLEIVDAVVLLTQCYLDTEKVSLKKSDAEQKEK